MKNAEGEKSQYHLEDDKSLLRKTVCDPSTEP